MSGARAYDDEDPNSSDLTGAGSANYNPGGFDPGGYEEVAEAPAPGPARGGLNPVTSPGAGAAPPVSSRLTPYGQALVAGIHARRAERAAPAEPEPVGDFYDAAPQIEAPVVEHGFAHDMTRRVWAATKEMAGSLVSAAALGQRAMGDSPEAIAWVNRQRETLRQDALNTLATMSPNRRAAANTKIFGDQEIDPTTGKKFPTPGEVGWATVAADRVASFIPQLPMLFMGPAGWTTRILSGLLFGAMGAGDAYAGAADTIHAMTAEQLRANPVSAEVLKGGGTDEQAREALLKGAAVSWQSLAALGGGAAVGVGLRGAVKPGAVGHSLLPRMAIGGGEAGAVLGAQSGGMEALQQSTEMGLGTRQAWDPEKLALAAASGAAGGLAIGGIAQGVFGRRPERTSAKPQPTIEGVSAEQQAGMETALGPVTLPPRVQGELDLSQAPPGNGELFRPIEQANPPMPGAAPAGPPAAPPPPATRTGAGMVDDQGRMVRPPGGPADVPPPPAPTPGAPIMAMPTQGELPNITPAISSSPGELKPQTTNVTPAVSSPPGAITTPAAARPSANMTVGQLRDALTTMPGQDPRALKAMNKTDLAARYDQLQAGEAPASRETQTAPIPPAPDAVVRPPAAVAAAPEPPARVETAASVRAAAPVEVPPEVAKPTTVVEPPPPSAPEPPAKTPLEIARAKVQAKRAEQKARLKPTELTEKPAAAVGYTEPDTQTSAEAEARLPATRSQIEDRRTGAIQRVTAALNVAGRRIETLKKGQDVQPIVSRVMRELAERIGRTDGSDGAVEEQVTGWARANRGKIPGATTSFYDVGDHVLRLLTGHGIPEREGFMKGAAKESEAQPVRFETEKPGEETTTVVAHDPAAEAGPDKPKAPTTDHEKIANRLLDDVLEGKKTAAEAHAEFGQQGEGAGRRRREGLENFPAFLRREIARAEDPKLREAILNELIRTQAETGERGATKGNTTKAETRLLERTSPEHVNRLREMLREIEDPVGHAADRASGPEPLLREEEAPRATPDGLRDPLTSRYVRMIGDPRLNTVTREAAARPDATNHDVLQAIVDHAVIRDEARPLHEIAKVLLQKVGKLPTVTPTQAFARGWMTAKQYANVGREHVAGAYFPASGERGAFITLHPKAERSVETVLHENLHAVEFDYVEMLQHIDPHHNDLQALQAIGRELHRLESEAYRRGELNGRIGHDVSYALSSPHELLAMLHTNPEVQAFAADARASPQFRATMARLDFAPREPGRSVWRFFTDWVRKALGLTKPASLSEYTLLDHLLRPMREILDHAVAHNDQYLPRDPVLRESAEPLMHETTKALDPRRENIAERVLGEARSGRAGDVVRGKMMPTMNDDRMQDHWGHIFQVPETKDPVTGQVLEPARNLMENRRTAVERIAARSKKFMDDFHDAARDIASRLKGKDDVAALELAAGYAKAHLGNADPNANDHLTTPAERARLADLEAQYARMPADDRKLYQEHLALGGKIYQEKRAADLNSMVDAIMPDATRTQKAAILEGLKSKKSLDAFLKDPDNSAIAATFTGQGGFARYRDTLRAIAKFHAQGFVQGDYFEMQRLGNYVVVYGEHGEPNYGVEMFESRQDANARRQELLDQNVPDVQQIRERNNPTASRLPPSIITDELVDAARKSPALKANVDELRDMLDQIRLRHATQGEFGRTRARRKGIAGASKEASRILASSVAATAHQIGHIEHELGRVRALQAMRAHADYLARNGGEAHVADQLIHEFEARDQHAEAAQHGLGSLARSLTSFGYVQSLLSFSRIFTEGTENTLRAGAWIGARHGHLKTAWAMGRAMSEVGPKLLQGGVVNMMTAVRRELHQSEFNLSKVAEKRLIDSGRYDRREIEGFFKHFQDAGLFDSTWARSVQQLAKPGGFRPAWQQFMDMSGAMGHATEELTRIAPTWAAYQLERAAGRSPAEARAYAGKILRKAPNWNPGLQARITTDRGVLGRFAMPMTQFKKYGLNEYPVLFTAVRDSLKGATSEQRRETAKALAGIIAVHSLMAGVLTWVADPVRYILGAYDWATGGTPHDYMPNMRAFIADMLGPELGEIVSLGIPHAAGIDVSQRLGVRNMLNIPQLNSFDAKGWATAIGTGLMGAAGQDATTVAGGFFKLMQGDFSGLQDVVPRIVRDPIKAARLATVGVRDTTGKVILPPEKISTKDVIAQGLGFQPSVVSEARAGRSAVLQKENEWKAERSNLERRWLEADPIERAAVLSEIRAWNAEHHGMGITMGQLMRQQQAQRKQARAPFGLRLPPKAAQELASAGRFATQ